MHEGHRTRLRNQFLCSGLDSFSDIQVLEYLLTFAIARKDVNPLAHALLDRFGSLANVLDAPPERLQEVDGIGEHAAALLSLMPQLLRRYAIGKNQDTAILSKTEDVCRFLQPYFFGINEEVVYMVGLDAKCKVLSCSKLFEGGLNAVSINIRKVVETALLQHATSVILAHNHPWGVAVPSREDEQVTREVEAALELVGIALADHIIAAGDESVSMADSGMLHRCF